MKTMQKMGLVFQICRTVHCKKNLPYPEGGWGNLLGFLTQTVARPEKFVGFMGKAGTLKLWKSTGLNYDFFVVLTDKDVAEPETLLLLN